MDCMGFNTFTLVCVDSNQTDQSTTIIISICTHNMKVLSAFCVCTITVVTYICIDPKFPINMHYQSNFSVADIQLRIKGYVNISVTRIMEVLVLVLRLLSSTHAYSISKHYVRMCTIRKFWSTLYISIPNQSLCCRFLIKGYVHISVTCMYVPWKFLCTKGSPYTWMWAHATASASSTFIP